MAWIESHQSLKEHPKTKRLVRALGISLPEVIGHLHLMWWYCLDYAPDGDLSFDRFTVEDIADMACWTRDAHVFVDALQVSGFLEHVGDRLIIHDWFDYAGKLIERRQANAERMREARAAQEKPRANHVQRTSTARAGATVPNRTKPNPQYSEAFLAFFAAYPKHVNKKAAFAAWEKINPDADLIATIMAAVERQKTGRKWIEGWANAPDVWLRGEKWDDEPEPLRQPSFVSQADHNQVRRNPDGTLRPVY